MTETRFLCKTNKYGITTTFAVVVMLLLFMASCGKENKEVVEVTFDPENTYTLRTTDVSSLISDSGITRYRMNAKEWLVFGKAKEPYSYFPQGVYVEKFDSLFNVEASVKADTAYYWDKKGLYKLIGHVGILSQEGKKLNTSILYFDQKEDQIYTDEYFELEEGDKIITGIGFKSNQNMTKYKIFNSQGTFPVSDTARDTSRVNTATGDSVVVNIAKPDSIK
ncbi:LPS export ABC transporter periplasmic protein LptC [Parabacteroides sp. AM58-2XD]|uniref:LPS export ABC transporter periplasmic protein LptC n=1 Tax=Parabacteroides sp. AM58-2XD TaxID=2292362 RepID=UPI000FE1F63D|nr:MULTISPECIES: LPS export ABC transporter periplasmic protein LptC [Parabacteroides]RGY96606.1 LPS export ABC transporter periplasmic protein LptC [Parabacteroides sp. AM58-2XD]GKG75963.1 LPS export ABC transporter periplasmic protein LptC [Parabacteroides goldsteinii]GKG80629.1 LPS export ABC transporter periplasmic protein LptC [Parabacteroides goldsteinii]